MLLNIPITPSSLTHTQPYAPATLESAFKHWRYASGYPGFLTSDDFLLFVQYADERSSRKEAQR
jgi:hypothetical protein